MILISEDGKSYVLVESWEDVVTRPGYKSKLDPKKIKLKQILGKYHIDPKQPCGISSCGTYHNMGFLVLCEGGIETNIGHRCGKNIFGVDFQAMEREFTKDINAQRYRDNIKTFQNKINNFDSKIQYLRTGDHQGDWCYKKMHFYATRGFEQGILEALHVKAKSRDRNITKIIQLTAQEQEIARETGNTDTFKTEVVGTINGISAITKYKKIRNLLNDKLGQDISAFKLLNVDTLKYDQLKYWNNWINQFDKRLLELELIITECNRFLLKSNLDEIRKNKHYLR